MNHFPVSLKQENGSCRDEDAGEPPQKVACDWASAGEWAGRWLMGNDVTRRRERESKITRPDLHTCSLSFRLLPVTMETPVGLFSGELRC